MKDYGTGTSKVELHDKMCDTYSINDQTFDLDKSVVIEERYEHVFKVLKTDFKAEMIKMKIKCQEVN